MHLGEECPLLRTIGKCYFCAWGSGLLVLKQTALEVMWGATINAHSFFEHLQADPHRNLDHLILEASLILIGTWVSKTTILLSFQLCLFL